MIAAILAILSFALQNLCCKEYGRRYPSTFYTQTAMAAFCTVVVTLIMAALDGARALTAKGFVIATCFGICFFITLTSMTLALCYGHMGITLLIQNSSLVVLVLYGILFLGEKLTIIKGIGTVCIMILLIMSAGGDSAGQDTNGKRNRKLWVVFTGLSFAGDSALGILQGMMSRECESVTAVTFTFWTSLFSAVLAFVCIAVYALTGKRERLCRDKKDALTFSGLCAMIGAGTAGGNCFSITALLTLPGVVLFPLRQGALVLVMWLLGVLLYKEKITKRSIAMLLIGLTGIVLLNF